MQLIRLHSALTYACPLKLMDFHRYNSEQNLVVGFLLLAGEGKLKCLSCVEIDIYPKHIEICTGLILNMVIYMLCQSQSILYYDKWPTGYIMYTGYSSSLKGKKQCNCTFRKIIYSMTQFLENIYCRSQGIFNCAMITSATLTQSL